MSINSLEYNKKAKYPRAFLGDLTSFETSDRRDTDIGLPASGLRSSL